MRFSPLSRLPPSGSAAAGHARLSDELCAPRLSAASVRRVLPRPPDRDYLGGMGCRTLGRVEVLFLVVLVLGCGLSGCSGSSCEVRACFYAPDGSSALIGDREAWFFLWRDGRDSSGPVGLTLDGDEFLIERSWQLRDPCVRFWIDHPEACEAVTLWTKIQGFELTGTRASCNHTVNQTVQPSSPESEKAEFCDRPLAPAESVVPVTLQEPDGTPITSYYVMGDYDGPDAGQDVGYFQTAWIRDGVLYRYAGQPAAFAVPNHLPRVVCVPSEAATVTMEPLPFVCHEGCSWTANAAGWKLTSVPLLVLAATIATRGLLARRARRRLAGRPHAPCDDGPADAEVD
jgi:hypothetical protein